MKKLTLAVLAVFVTSAAFAGNWGLGLKLGGGQNDPKTLQDLLDTYGGELDKVYGFFSIEGQYEAEMTETGRLGVRLGLDAYGDNEFKYGSTKVSESTYGIPLTLYYRWDNGIKGWSYYAGAGATYIRTEWEEGSLENHKSKIFPHVVGGVEYRFTQLFALGVEAKYNISAKIEKDGYKTDRSGISGALVGRFYF